MPNTHINVIIVVLLFGCRFKVSPQSEIVQFSTFSHIHALKPSNIQITKQETCNIHKTTFNFIQDSTAQWTTMITLPISFGIQAHQILMNQVIINLIRA